MAPVFTGSKFGFGRSAAAAPLGPTDVIIANLSSTSYSSSQGVDSSSIPLPPSFTKLVVFGVSAGGGSASRNDGDNGHGGGGGGAGYITGYDIPFASITGSTITVAAGRGGNVSPTGPTGGEYPLMPPSPVNSTSFYQGSQGGPSYVQHPPGAYLWRALGGGGGKAGANFNVGPYPSTTRVGGSGGTMDVGTGQVGGAGGTGYDRNGPEPAPSKNGSPGLAGGGGGGGAWGSPWHPNTTRGSGGSGAAPSSYTTPDGRTTINFTNTGTNLAIDGRPNYNLSGEPSAGGFAGSGISYSITTSLPIALHPAPLNSPGYIHGGGGGGFQGNGQTTTAPAPNTPFAQYGKGGGGFILVVAIGVPS